MTEKRSQMAVRAAENINSKLESKQPVTSADTEGLPKNVVSELVSKIKAARITTMGKRAGAIDLPPIDVQKGIEQSRKYVDALKGAFTETLPYLQRTGPETYRKGVELAATPDILEAEMNKFEHLFRGFTEKERKAFGAAIIEDRNLSKGTHTYNPTSFLQNPKVRALVDEYNRIEQSIYPTYRESGGYGAAQSRGKVSGSYLPLYPSEYADMFTTPGSGGRPSTKPIAELSKMPGESRFEGKLNSTNAITDPLLAHRLRLSRLIPAAKLRDTLRTAKAEGLLTEVENAEKLPDGRRAINVNGRLEPAQDISISERTGIPETELEAMGLPKRALIASNALSELEPVLSNIKNPAVARNSPLNALIRGYLLSPSEVGAHTFTLSSLSRASQERAVKTGFAPMDRLLSTMGPVRTIAGIKDILTLNHSKADRLQAELLAARAGVFREIPKKIDVTQPGQYILYGPKGVYSNALTGVYRMMKEFGASDAEIMDAFRTLPSHLKTRQPAVQKLLNTVGMGTFYQTGMKSLETGVKHGFSPKRLVGTAAFLTIAGTAMDYEKKPWFDKDRKLLPGQFALGKDEKGRLNVGDLRFDRTTRVAMETPTRMIQAAQRGADTQEVLQTGLRSAVNQAVRPAMSGPVPYIGSRISGRIPYLVPPSHDLGLADVLPDPMAKTSLINRLKHSYPAILPITALAFGDPSEDYQSTKPKSEDIQMLNRILRAAGQMPIRAVDTRKAEQRVRELVAKRKEQERRESSSAR